MLVSMREPGRQGFSQNAANARHANLVLLMLAVNEGFAYLGSGTFIEPPLVQHGNERSKERNNQTRGELGSGERLDGTVNQGDRHRVGLSFRDIYCRSSACD